MISPAWAMAILMCSPLGWEFPWWLWVLAILFSGDEIRVKYTEGKK